MQRVGVSVFLFVVVGAVVAAGALGNPQQAVPRGAIALVGGEAVPQALFDAEMARRRHTHRLNKKRFPRTGTPAYRAIKDDVVAQLVWRVQLRQSAAAIGIRVDPREVERRINQLRQQRASNERQFARELRNLGLTVALLRADIFARLTLDAVRTHFGREVAVEAHEIHQLYESNLSAFTTPATRQIRRLVVRDRATAERVYGLVARGASFAAVVRRYSTDRETRRTGGVVTLYAGGGNVEEVAFALPRGGISAPIRSGGWQVVQALSEITPGTLLELAQVEASVREAVRSIKTEAALAAWITAVKASYVGRVVYAPGFAPSNG